MGRLEKWADRLEEKTKNFEKKNAERQERFKELDREKGQKVDEAKAHLQEVKQQVKEERSHKEKPTEQEKFYKRANTAGKGIAFYFALPLFFGIALVLLLIGFQIWEWIF